MKDTQDTEPQADLDYFERYLNQETIPGWKTLSLSAVVDLDKLKTLIAEVKALRTAVICKDRVAKQWKEAWRGVCETLREANDKIMELEARNKGLEARNKHLGERCGDLEKRNYTLESSGSLYLGSPASYWGQLWEELYVKHQNLVTNGSEARKELEDRIKDLEAQLLGKFYRGQTALYWAKRFEETLKDLQAARKSIKDLNDIHGL